VAGYSFPNESKDVVVGREGPGKAGHVDDGPSIPPIRTICPEERGDPMLQERRKDQGQENKQNESTELVASPLAEDSHLPAVVPPSIIPSEESPCISAQVLFHHFLHNCWSLT